jgi:hypothetical protein
MKPFEIVGASGAVGNDDNLAFPPVIVEGFDLRETANRGLHSAHCLKGRYVGRGGKNWGGTMARELFEVARSTTGLPRRAAAAGQRIAEFADPDMAIHITGSDGNGHSCQRDGLFPEAFGLEPLP